MENVVKEMKNSNIVILLGNRKRVKILRGLSY